MKSGITLIALIITIIVLVILAGVSISLTTGENGIVSKAMNSSNKINEQSAKEEVEMAYSAILSKYYDDYTKNANLDKYEYITYENLDEELMGIGTIYEYEYDSDKKEITLTYGSNGKNAVYEMKIDENGKASILNNSSNYDGIGVVSTLAILCFIVDGVQYRNKIRSTRVKFPNQAPSKDGYIFTGWYYDQDVQNRATEGDEVAEEEITLYAGWQKNISGFSYAGDSTTISRSQYSGVSYNTEETYGDSTNKFFNMYNNEYATVLLINYSPEKNISSYEIVEKNLYAFVGYTDSESTSMYSNDSITTQILDNGVIVIKTPDTDNQILRTNGTIKVRVTYDDNTTEEYTITVNTYLQFTALSRPCFVEGTKITLSNGTKKNIEDITYTDKLLVWNFDDGKIDVADPLWIMKKQTVNSYTYLKFDNGVELNIVGHRIFNSNKQEFTRGHLDEFTPIGTEVFLEDETKAKLIERKEINKKVNIYNIISNYHMNVFAEGILTSWNYNNLYPIKNMKFIKDNRKLNEKDDYKNIPEKYFEGLRLAELDLKKIYEEGITTLDYIQEVLMKLEK